MGHILALALWAFGLGNLVAGYPGIFGTLAAWALGLLIAAHIAETLFVLKRIRQSSEPFWPNVFKSLVFGYFHIRRFL
ncbi:DUF1145 domain-containing protein [Pseudoruegeria sp. SK021]|uniref:DUF1145 domain-containing protein n=1 Tax=Pseudoruegeria sp. SK021 TaxID=1933035 RepID=UPI000A22FDAF|nr:DUF1145 domain-containing protein [Pseudoruegeria sp. SK021]OSP53588.1 hypothetical protein BV911_17140 [Pseudoruegeria sp. SK021]